MCGRGVQTFSSHVHSDFEHAIEKFTSLSTKEWNAKYGPGFPSVAELLLHVDKRDGEGPKMDSRRARLFPDDLFREVDIKEEERANQTAYGNKNRPNGKGSKFPFARPTREIARLSPVNSASTCVVLLLKTATVNSLNDLLQTMRENTVNVIH